MGFGKLGPIQGHAAVATCRPSGSGRDSVLLFIMKEVTCLICLPYL